MPQNSQDVIDNQLLPILFDNSLVSEYLTDLERNDVIAFLHLLKGVKQVDIAEKYGITRQAVCAIIDKYRSDEDYKRLINIWTKKTSLTARSKALEIIESIKVSKIPEGSKATSGAILIDKARLLDGEDVPGSDRPAQINIVNYGEVNVNK